MHLTLKTYVRILMFLNFNFRTCSTQFSTFFTMDPSQCLTVLSHPDGRSGGLDKEELEHHRRRSLEMRLPLEEDDGDLRDLPISPNEFYQFRSSFHIITPSLQ